MMNKYPFCDKLKHLIFFECFFLGITGMSYAVNTRGFDDIQSQNEPLILKGQGSFFVGGDNEEQTFDKHVNAAGGNAQMMSLPDEGIPGNSHMLMQDTNSLEIPDIILLWISENVND